MTKTMLMQIRILVLLVSILVTIGTTTSYADVKGEQLLHQAERITRQTRSIEAHFADNDTAPARAALRLMRPGFVYLSVPDDKGNLNTIVSQEKRLLNVDEASHSGSRMDCEDLYNIANFVPYALYVTCFQEPSQYRSFVNPTYVGTRKRNQATYQVVTCPPSYGRGATTFYIGESGLPEGITIAAVKNNSTNFPAQEFWLRDVHLNAPLAADQFTYMPPSSIHIEDQDNPAFQFLRVGDRAPDFVLSTPSGKRLSSASLRKDNRAILLNFTFAECGACILELPMLKQLHLQTKAQGLACIAINLLDDKAKANHFIAKYQVVYPMGLDSKAGGGSSQVSNGYRVDMGGVNYLIGKDGKVLWRYAGMNEVRLRCVLDEIHIHTFTPKNSDTSRSRKHFVQKP